MMSETRKQPTYKRQRFLLAFIRQLDGSIAATDLQKLVFLNTMAGDSDFYEFIPYMYGSYSFQLKEDLDILQRDGFVKVENIQNSIQIKAVGNFQKDKPFIIALERGNDLIRRAYREYPYYAINSTITSKLFRGEELERFNNGKQAYAKTEQVLFTIGYEGKSIEAFINSLIQNDIHLLCDVRKNPFSRKFGFSKGKLEHITQTVNIKYAHIPDLGIDSDKRASLNTAEDYQYLFKSYEKSLPARKAFLDEIYAMLHANNRIALMCFEHEPQMCHRHVVRDFITKTYRVRSVDI
jgi:uncharacterized protein (DUF488 family)